MKHTASQENFRKPKRKLRFSPKKMFDIEIRLLYNKDIKEMIKMTLLRLKRKTLLYIRDLKDIDVLALVMMAGLLTFGVVMTILL